MHWCHHSNKFLSKHNVRIKKTIKKAFIIAAWLVVGSGMLTLLIAANQKEQAHTCKKLIVTIKGSGSTYAIDKEDIIKRLQTSASEKLIGKALSDFNLVKLEDQLKKDLWIGDADIYFDSQDALHVLITEKDPIARVFTASGNSFYLDSSARRMPLLDKVSIRLPVFTNFPDAKVLKAKDSALLNDVKQVARFINKDPFWSAQIAQIDITENNTFEAIPVVGNHIIKIGKAEGIETKFKKLFLFYQMVLSKTGFDKYSILDIQFTNQVVATRKGAVSAIDSVQLQRNIQELLTKNNLQLQKENEGEEVVKPEAPTMTIDTASVHDEKPAVVASDKKQEAKISNKNKVSVKRNSTSVKPKLKQTTSKPVRKPKAVMPKRTAD